MNIKTYGTAFTSYDVKANKQTKEELVNENVSFNDDIKKIDEIENISYHTTTESSTSKPTVFKDPTNDKYVITSLDDTTIEKLKTHFSEDDFIEKEDGSIRLTGESEAFVSGWFADIAYKRDFLEADVNDDGEISKSEYRQTKNNFEGTGESLSRQIISNGHVGEEKMLYVSEKIIDTYTKAVDSKSVVSYRDTNSAKSLDDELNTTINIDENFDGIITLTEAYTTEGDESAENVVIRHLQEVGLPTEFVKDSNMSSLDISLVNAFDKFVQMSPDERAEHLEEMALKRKEKKEHLEEIKQEKKDIASDKAEDDLIEFRIEEIVAMMIEKENQKSLENMVLDIYV